MTTPSPGRRIASTGPRRVDRGAVVAAVLAVLAMGAVLVGGSRSVPPEEGTRTTGVLVDSAVHGCPRFAARGGTRTTVSTGSAPVAGRLGDDGSVRRGLPGSGDTEPLAVARGELVSVESGAGDPPWLTVEAQGPVAAGLFTAAFEQRGDDTTAATRCAAPATTWWFTGAGATLDHTADLIVSNVDPGPAVVDIRVLGPDGEVDTVGTRGVTVPPHEQTTVPMTDIAPQGEELAVQVTTSRGRVVAALSDRFTPGPGEDTGTSWLPPQPTASRVLRVAGLPGRADSHQLVLANPSGREALVELEVSGSTGAFTPTEDAQVRVPPGSVVSTDLTGAVGRDPSALTLRANVPVTGSVRSFDDGDSTYAGAVRPLTGPAAVPLLPQGTGTIQLTATARPATAGVVAYRADGTELDSTTVEVDAGATGTWRAPRRADYLVVTPQQGRVFGALTIDGAPGTGQLPLRTLDIRVDQPTVRPALDQSASAS